MTLGGLAVRVAPVIVLIVGGAWGYAAHDVAGRVASARSEIAQQSYARGGRLPTAAEVRDRAEQVARDHDVALQDVDVAVDADAPANGTGRIVADTMGPDAIVMRYQGYTVTGRATAHRWWVLRDEPLRVQFSLRSETTMPSVSHVREPLP